jgi:hypothetical protein
VRSLTISQDPAEPTPEQTTSLLSFATWSFLDSIIWKAYKVPHLSSDMLPAVADYDRAKNLKSRTFKHLDVFSGAKPRYLLWGLMRVFWREILSVFVLTIIDAVANFGVPIAIYGLLGCVTTAISVNPVF